MKHKKERAHKKYGKSSPSSSGSEQKSKLDKGEADELSLNNEHDKSLSSDDGDTSDLDDNQSDIFETEPDRDSDIKLKYRNLKYKKPKENVF